MKISGIIPALVTPFDKNGKIDHGALTALVKRLLEQGVGGFYACGSTSECFLMTDDERKAVLETVIKAADGRAPVIAHVGNIGSEKTCELARHARMAGAAAVSSVPPFYYRFSFEEIASYYGDIANAVPELPLIVYNIPIFSGVEINSDNLKTIIDASGAQGLKYTSYNLFEMEKISRRFPQLTIFNGHDEVYLNALSDGATSAIGSTFNIMAPKFIKLKELYEAGDIPAAEKKQSEINVIIEMMIKVGVNQSVKYLLTKSGIDCGDCRKPFAKITPSQAECLDSIYNKVIN
ncbi:MAG: N-acetylneuraminate lyase [Clostridia bacterium]|nr:N-acetylneuraminate lyase [Clostridia bacterium]